MLFTFITVKFVIDESSKYSKSGESHECTETSENVVADPYYWNSYDGTRTTHFKRDANVSDSGEQSYYEKITADWTNHANEQGNLEYKISADSEITVKAKGDYSSYLYEYSDNEFDGCYRYSNSSSYGCNDGCGCYCYYYYYSYSSNGSLHTYSENERTIDVSEHYDSELHEKRHTDGGAFERVSFDGWANGGGNSSNPTHQFRRVWSNLSPY
jgi:hypothetical protein